MAILSYVCLSNPSIDHMVDKASISTDIIRLYLQSQAEWDINNNSQDEAHKYLHLYTSSNSKVE